MSTVSNVDLDPLEEHLLEALRTLEPSGTLRSAPPEAEEIWRAQVDSRQADYAARWLQQHGRSFYTIGSAGHESNAAVALALRVDDPALLHYRSGAFYLARAGQAEIDGLRDMMLGVVAAAVEPIAGGRHKVFGRKELAVLPMTSTIASHLPRAVGMALAIDRAERLGVASPWPQDAVVLCSFGDASLNHATAQAALNTTAQITYQGLPLPLLFVCEDNGLGISVPTPPGWVESALTARSEIRYEIAYGHDPAEVLGVATELAEWVREQRRPAVLHLRTVRYLSHAGADAEMAYRTPQAIRADYERDPILGTARWLVSAGRATGVELANDYLAAGQEAQEIALEAAGLPQMTTRRAGDGSSRTSLTRQSSPRRRRGSGSPPMSLDPRAVDQRWACGGPRTPPERASSSVRTSPRRGACTASRAGFTRASAPGASSTRSSTRPRSSGSRSAQR